ncbi:MAG: hypothetical protein EX269_02680 [Acidimicrobiales bacterium]|nr:MAG: hypothetical protein EX269_02680 [Acidimicrobiales bacterium]
MAGPLRGRTIKPMKATSGTLPTGGDWLYEIKWDGMRIVAFIDEDGLRLQTTNLIDATVRFPELAGLAEQFAGLDAVILDGELVAAGTDGAPSFGRMQERMHISDPTEARRRSLDNPVTFVIFDLLHVNGTDTHALPLVDRRKLLEDLVEPGEHWRLTDVHEDGANELLDVVIEKGLEGLIAKQPTSRYIEGKRTSSWRKIKPRRRQEFVVGGWAAGKEGRAGSIGSLLLGYYEDGSLRHCGSVGSGLNAENIAHWQSIIDDTTIEDSPFDGPVPSTMGRSFHWIEPRQVVEVAFGEWTADGHLRHPSYIGHRGDKDPREVVKEP